MRHYWYLFKNKIIPQLPQCYIVTLFLSLLQRINEHKLMNLSLQFQPLEEDVRNTLTSLYVLCELTGLLFVGVRKSIIIMAILIAVGCS